MQGRAGCEVDANAQFRHQQVVHPSHVDQGELTVWLDLYEDVDITVGASLSPCRRAEEIRGRHAPRTQCGLAAADFGKGMVSLHEQRIHGIRRNLKTCILHPRETSHVLNNAPRPVALPSSDLTQAEAEDQVLSRALGYP